MTGRRASQGSQAPTRSPWPSVLVFVGGAIGLPVVSFFLGIWHFESVNCSAPDFDGECDVAAIEGLVWGLIAFLLICLTAIWFVVRNRRRLPRVRREGGQ